MRKKNKKERNSTLQQTADEKKARETHASQQKAVDKEPKGQPQVKEHDECRDRGGRVKQSPDVGSGEYIHHR
jgi:hypothetical protein